ncbi:lytic transglycosylase domain-containing protein [Embleya sp. AB8]|uniref:lytic transglycosylase domain-containing protein n=1 Tax=Embleya sp. AB8 TaxID=3156304 RepID=UPI003C794F10
MEEAESRPDPRDAVMAAEDAAAPAPGGDPEPESPVEPAAAEGEAEPGPESSGGVGAEPISGAPEGEPESESSGGSVVVGAEPISAAAPISVSGAPVEAGSVEVGEPIPAVLAGEGGPDAEASSKSGAVTERISAVAAAPEPAAAISSTEPEPPEAPAKRRRILNPWLGSAAAILVVLACGAAVQSPFTMVTAHRVPTSDLPRLSDPAPADGTSANGGGPAHFELPPPVVPAALPGAPASSAPPTAPGATTPAGTRGTTATGTGGIPQTVLLAYQQAASNLARMDPGCKLPWTLLAGIGRVESEHAYGGNVTADGTAVTPILGPRLDGTGGFARIPDTDGGRYDFDTEFDRAVGPMQFIPSTWKAYAMDGNGDGVANPQNIFDATLTAGRYLCAGGRDLSTGAGLNAAILSYNHSDEYLRTVLTWMNYYATGARSVPDNRQPGKPPVTTKPPAGKPTPTKPAPPPVTTSTSASAPVSGTPSTANQTDPASASATTSESGAAR